MIGYDDVKTRATKHAAVLRCCLPYAGPLHAHGRSERRSVLVESVSAIEPTSSSVQVVVFESCSSGSMLANFYDTADEEQTGFAASNLNQ
jgi:hypothetical protein